MDRSEQGNELENLERRLGTWAIRDLSDDAKSDCDDLIDRLAGVEPSDGSNDADSSSERRKPWLWSSAAVLTIGLLTWFVSSRLGYQNATASLATASSVPGVRASDFTLLRSVNRVDAREDDGLIIPSNGDAPHYRYRYHVVDEEQVKDKKTGTVITLRQPRLEILTVPVTQF